MFLNVGFFLLVMGGSVKLERNFRKFKNITSEESLIAKQIEKSVDIKEGQKILDVGCASGDLSRALVNDSSNITFLDVDEFDFSDQEEFIHSSFEDARIDKKYDFILTSHVWGHFWRNNTFNFCFDKAIDLLNDSGKLIVVHNSNNDFMGELIKFSKGLFIDIEFDVFEEDVLKGMDYSSDYFDVDLKANSYEELAELVQVLIIVPDELYYEKFDDIV